MDPSKLRKMADELAAALEAGAPSLVELKTQLGRLLSHCESEQRVTVNLEKRMNLLEKQLEQHDRVLFGDRADIENHPGVVSIVGDVKSAKKLLSKVVGGVSLLVVVEIIRIAFHALKP